MKAFVFAVALLAPSLEASADDALCQTARAAVERLAASRKWQADVRCRMVMDTAPADDAVLQAIAPPEGILLRSGPATWAVRVQAARASYIQRVPLTITWRAPAWVSRRDLVQGALLQPDDIELRALSWPDGMAVVPAREEAPPTGRLRQAVRAGDMLSAGQLWPADALVRGDHVTAVLAEGAMEIRLPAQLLASARVGERVRAQVQGRTATLEGRLADAQTLKVDSP
ncbi:MAG TPA: flagella basal body P-ring formation protein FlgA [Roseateles sp.]